MIRTSRVLPALLLALGAVLLAACRPVLPPPPSGTGVPVVATVDPASYPEHARSTGRVPQTVLRVATGDTGDGLIPHRQIIAQFTQAHPDVGVVLESITSSDYYKSLLDEIAAGNPPDIMQIGDDAVPLFVRRGALAPLNPYMFGSEPLDPSIYLPGVFQPGTWQGKQYLLPKDFSSLAVYYNKKLFDQYGVPYPRDGWTWDDFLRTAQALTRRTPGQTTPEVWGVQLPGAWTSGFEYWVAATGGQLISESGRSYTGYMDAPPAVQAAQFYRDLYLKYQVAPPPADMQAFAGGNQEFADGKAAMMVLGRWPQAELRKNPKIDLGVVGMPVGKQRANVLFWGGFGIANGSTHKDAAWSLRRFYTGIQAARTWAGWGLPTVTSVATSSGLRNDPVEGVWLGELNYLKPRAYAFTDYWSSTADPALHDALDELISDPEANVTDTLHIAAARAQTELDRSGR